MLKIYLASPIAGMSFNKVITYYANVIRRLSGFQTFHPMVGKGLLEKETAFKSFGYDTHPLITNHAILQRDCWMIQQSDVVYVNFSASKKISIGCCMELAMAHLLRKYTVVVLPKDNLNNHAFVQEAADVIFYNEDEAIEYLNKLSMSVGGDIAL